MKTANSHVWSGNQEILVIVPWNLTQTIHWLSENFFFCWSTNQLAIMTSPKGFTKTIIRIQDLTKSLLLLLFSLLFYYVILRLRFLVLKRPKNKNNINIIIIIIVIMVFYKNITAWYHVVVNKAAKGNFTYCIRIKEGDLTVLWLTSNLWKNISTKAAVYGVVRSLLRLKYHVLLQLIFFNIF